jgi:predicted CoA-substrate-specific enzyme activase
MLPGDAGSSHSLKTVIGVDIGSTFSKAVVLSNHAILAWYIVPSRGDYRAVADEVVSCALEKAGLTVEDIAGTIATGYGAGSVGFADQSANDISCQGRGISYLSPTVRTVVDIGGQFTRVFRVDIRGRVIKFVLSEKCAAGSGRLLQLIARVLQVKLDDMGRLSLRSKKRVDFNTGCAVFTESEVVSRIADGETKEDIAAGVNRALAAKVQSLVERLGYEPDCALVGGGAKNVGLVSSIKGILGFNITIPEEPQIVAALGAALIAEEMAALGHPPVAKEVKGG